VNVTTCPGASLNYEAFDFGSEGGGGLEGITFPHYVFAQANSSEAITEERLDCLGTPFPFKQPDFKNQANTSGKMHKKFEIYFLAYSVKSTALKYYTAEIHRD